MDYRYKLAPYSGKSSRLVCPNCGRREFSPYVDTETGEILDETCGRCNRESHCGYHLTPAQYFEQNPGARPQGDAWRQAPKGQYQYRKPKQRLPLKPKPAGPICELPKDIVEKTVRMEPESNFVKFLDTILDPLIVEGLVFMYNLGLTRTGATIFFQKDLQGRYRGGKIIQYNPLTGKRIKDEGANQVNWVHPSLQKRGYIPDNWSMTQCLFGEHLLKEYPDKIVCLVESEKSAVICAGFLPEYNWLATGGKTQLGEKLNVLKGYDVIALPDIDAVEFWTDYFAKFTGADIKVEDPYGDDATDEDRENQIDIADWLIRWKTAEAVPTVSSVPYQPGTGHPTEQYRSAITMEIAKYFSPEAHHELDALITEFDLIPTTVTKKEENT